jgi:4-aminobutyrate aminotransferase-like enzyme/Ser/Thr protein kinase RdoA (MazF antagonist)
MVFRSLELPNPRLSQTDALAILREHWSLEGVLDEVGSTQDQNFRVRCPDGRRFVLKIANPNWRREELELQNAAMHHLAGRRPGFEVPIPIPAADGSEIVRVEGHDVRLVSWLEGTPLSEAGHLPDETWRGLGRLAAASARELEDLRHPELDRDLQWDTRHARALVDALADAVGAEELGELEAALAPLAGLATGGLRVQPIHCDVTDYNTVAHGREAPHGLLDFGDTVRTWRACDPANAAVSAIAHDCEDPLGPALAVLAGFHAESPLDEAEIDAFWPLVAARAAVCAACSSHQARLAPDNEHVARAVLEDWAILRAVNGIAPELGVAAARVSCGLHPETWAPADAVPVLDFPLTPVDLSVTSLEAPAEGTLTRWGEIRLIAPRPSFVAPATLSLGVTAVTPAGIGVRAPLDATVLRAAPMLLAVEGGYVRLSGLASTLAAGDAVERGAPLGETTGPLYVQLSRSPDAPPYGTARERAAWLALCPDPSPLLGVDVRAPAPPDPALERQRRSQAVAAPQRLYYERPPEFVRGTRHFLYDAEGRPYVDAINNVAILGHSHPRVAEAAARQLRLLNTNSRFMYGAMATYAERLSALLPDELDSVFLVNSGSEAVDLALRLARAFTGRRDVIALEGAYHGWTTATDELCTNSIDRPNWRDELPPYLHIVEQPDPYRGRFGDDGPAYAEAVAAACREGGIAAFLSEPLLGNQGGIVAARGYLAAAYAATRAAGGVCIADEIQVGYGRTGETFWAFEHEGATPDIVCVAKATGNGHPVGAVICRRAIADTFDRAAPFFSSTGGGPVSCEIGIAVLDALAEEGLQENAVRIGARLRAGFERLAAEHPIIGAVHGRGLYLGVDLVRDPQTKEPAPAEALAISERLRSLGVIVQPTGDAFNVLKVKPPLCIDEVAADHLLAALERTLREGW